MQWLRDFGLWQGFVAAMHCTNSNRNSCDNHCNNRSHSCMIWKKYAQNHLTEIPISGTCHLVCSALYAIAYTNLAFDLKSPWRLNSNCTFNTIVKCTWDHHIHLMTMWNQSHCRPEMKYFYLLTLETVNALSNFLSFLGATWLVFHCQSYLGMAVLLQRLSPTKTELKTSKRHLLF